MNTNGERMRMLLEQALSEVKHLRGENAALRSAATEPVAVIGMGLRFPGGALDPASFWRVLDEGVDGIVDIPPQRWSPSPDGPSGARYGGFLDDVAGFDAEFFRISPREALRMDPQQRLLLEVSREALERAGIRPSTLQGTSAATYIGLMHADYAERAMDAAPEPPPEVYTATGNGHCFAAGRLSYSLGLQGPSMVVDTACSSSLVAVHLACMSLRNREADLALAGGVHVMLSRRMMELTARTGALSPEGRCRAFDAAANGFVRGEGVGVVVLKRLSDALDAGDPIQGVILGSAINQDGRSNGLTAPNYQAQTQLLRTALVRAGIAPDAVGYVETHGTGTPLGDPVEFEALRAVYGSSAAHGGLCYLGAVKTQIGHLEAAAGVAGLIKALLCLKHGRVPGNLHFEALNPRIDGSQTRIAIGGQAFALGPEAPHAAVSSFGLSGTNAHVVVARSPHEEPKDEDDAVESLALLCVSGRSEAAARALLHRYRDLFASAPPGRVARWCELAAVTRETFEHRIAVSAARPSDLVEAIGRRLEGTDPVSVRAPARPRIAFLFTGQGSQYVGMGRALDARCSAFRDSLDASHAWVERTYGWSLRNVLFEANDPERLNQTRYAQPALYALQLALVAQLSDWGIEPDVVLGHSVGEFAAAHVAGVFTAHDGLMLVCERGARMGLLSASGSMLSVGASEAELRARLDPWPEGLEIAAINSPRQLVLSGDAGVVSQLLGPLSERWKTTPLQVSHAFHSHHMDPMLEGFETLVEGVVRSRPCLPLISNLDGRIDPERVTRARYYRDQIRQPVQFRRCIETLLQQADLCVEIGPHPVLCAAVVATQESMATRVVAPLTRDRPPMHTLAALFATLYESGCDPNWERMLGRSGRRTRHGVEALPTYPFEHTAYLLDEASASAVGHFVEAPIDRGWRHRLDWDVERDLGHASSFERPTSCVVVGAAEGFAPRLTTALERHIGRPVKLCADVAGARSYVESSDRSAAGVLVVFAPDSTDEADGGVQKVADLATLTAVLQGSAARLAIVTRGVEWIHGDEDPSIEIAAVRGMATSLQIELGTRFAGSFDLPSSVGDGDVDAVVDRLWARGRAERIAALRRAEWVVPRLRSHDAGGCAAVPHFRDDRSYLITGGFGGIGIAVARWLVSQGAKHLVLTARRPVDGDPQRILQVEALRSLGASVRTAAIDVADHDSMRRLVVGLEAPLAGIFHTAGVASMIPAASLERDDVEAVFRGKVSGARVLDAVSRDLPIEYFVLFGSVSSVWGGASQAHYGAANRALEAVACRRRREGRPGLCVHWGFWAEGGLRDVDVEARFQAIGIEGMDQAGALDELGRLLLDETPSAIVANARWDVLSAALETHEAHRIFEHRLEATRPAARRGLLASMLAGEFDGADGLDESMLEARVHRLLVADVAALLCIDPERVLPEVPLTNMGMDSLAGLKLRTELERATGLQLPIRMLLENSQPRELIGCLCQRLRDEYYKQCILTRADDLEGESMEEFVL